MKNIILTIIQITLPLFLFAQNGSNTSNGSNGNAITIEESGKVGVNNDTPKAQLDVGGDINASGKIMQGNNELLPKGSIIMFHGENIPVGWALCDGNEGTPDLRGRFIVGVGKNANKENKVKDEREYVYKEEGGANAVALSVDEMPKHSHSVNLTDSKIYRWDQSFAGSGSGKYLRTLIQIYNENHKELKDKYNNRYEKIEGVNTKYSGSDNAHENRPPYYALYYIMKL